MGNIISKSIVAILLVFACCPLVVAAEQEAPSVWAAAAVREAIALGIVPERLQSNYQSPITREEFAELIVNTIFVKLKNEAGKSPVYWTPKLVLERVTSDVQFEDANQEHVLLAFILGAVNGVSETKFAPDAPITRQEAAVMLVNTVHYGEHIAYSGEGQDDYDDWGTVAEWARPAVSAAKHMDGLMEGSGGVFDPSGKFTREQSIATMIRLIDKNYHKVVLRGNLPVYEMYDELRYVVGRDYIKVVYKQDQKSFPDTPTEYALKGYWSIYEITKAHMSDYTSEKAIVMYAAEDVLKPRDYAEIVAPTLQGRQAKLDYGYMTVTTFNHDSLIEFRYKNVRGFMNNGVGYTYGYPKIQVEVTAMD